MVGRTRFAKRFKRFPEKCDIYAGKKGTSLFDTQGKPWFDRYDFSNKLL